jgi:hypothetical protein
MTKPSRKEKLITATLYIRTLQNQLAIATAMEEATKNRDHELRRAEEVRTRLKECMYV